MEQPRVPAGNPTGGQWTSRSGATSSRGDYNAISGKVSKDVRSSTKQKESRISQASQSVDRARKLLKSAGIDVDHLNVELTDRMHPSLPPDAIGASDQGTNQIYLNVGGRYYDRVYENQKELHAAGMHSSAHKDHVIVHEMAHQLHREKELRITVDHLRKEGFSSPAPLSGDTWNQLFNTRNIDPGVGTFGSIPRQVSRYAAQSPHEFVVETFTGGILGKRKYSDEVKKLYIELNGPYPEKVFGG